MVNGWKIVVRVTLIWRKDVAVSKCNNYRPEMALFKFDGLKIIPQTTKLNTPPIILRIRYLHRKYNLNFTLICGKTPTCVYIYIYIVHIYIAVYV